MSFAKHRSPGFGKSKATQDEKEEGKRKNPKANGKALREAKPDQSTRIDSEQRRKHEEAQRGFNKLMESFLFFFGSCFPGRIFEKLNLEN
mmetsp:Transcript_4740/g.6581  ORF Transcript_4740/g.6581 Transcript_4740/m.6581 type:complete len:90 (+) Transcript_4740:368-637(+)